MFRAGGRNKKLLVTKGITTRSKDRLVAPGHAIRNKKLLVTSASLLVTRSY